MREYKYYRGETLDRGEVWRFAHGSSEYTNRFKQTTHDAVFAKWSPANPTWDRILPIPDLALILLGYR